MECPDLKPNWFMGITFSNLWKLVDWCTESFSMSLEKLETWAIGRKLTGSRGSPPFLKSGVILDVLRIWGKLQLSMHLLMAYFSCLVRQGIIDFKSLLLMPSNPADDFDLKLWA